MPRLIETLRKEWPTLKTAPWSVAAIVSASLVAGFSAGFFTHGLVSARADHSASAAPSQSGSNSTATANVNVNALAAGTGAPQSSGAKGGKVGSVSSVNQSGGVTAGSVGNVNQK
jgi:hypothetical protein